MIAVATQHELYRKTASNVKEVKSRGATVIFICSDDMTDFEDEIDLPLYLPTVRDMLMPLVAVVHITRR